MAVFFDIFTLYSPRDDMFRCSDPPCVVLKTELDEFERMSLLALVRRQLRRLPHGHCEPSRIEMQRCIKTHFHLLLTYPMLKTNLH